MTTSPRSFTVRPPKLHRRGYRPSLASPVWLMATPMGWPRSRSRAPAAASSSHPSAATLSVPYPIRRQKAVLMVAVSLQKCHGTAYQCPSAW